MKKEHKKLLKFLSIALLIYLLWTVVEVLFLADGNVIEKFLTHTEAFLVANFFSLLGYTQMSYHYLPPDASIVMMDAKKIVGISDSCNGLVLFVTFIGFIIAFPASVRSKLRYIPIGILLIYIANVIRIFFLAMIYIYYPHYLNFNHHYTFTLWVYFDIFMLWMYFVKKYGRLQNAD